MTQILGAARTLFGEAFNPLIAQKALAYFHGGDLATLDTAMCDLLVCEAVVDLQPQPLPLAASTLA